MMKLMESRLLAIRIDDSGHEVVLSFIDTQGVRFSLQLHGVERLLVNEMRQQNVVEELIHWKRGVHLDAVREAAFALTTSASETDCTAQMAAVALEVADRVVRGELEMLEISAIFGAQVLASFSSMSTTAG
jgi:hypothetical protein